MLVCIWLPLTRFVVYLFASSLLSWVNEPLQYFASLSNILFTQLTWHDTNNRALEIIFGLSDIGDLSTLSDPCNLTISFWRNNFKPGTIKPESYINIIGCARFFFFFFYLWFHPSRESNQPGVGHVVFWLVSDKSMLHNSDNTFHTEPSQQRLI